MNRRRTDCPNKERSLPSATPQPVVAQLTRAAIFLVVTIKSEPECDTVVRGLCGDLSALLRAVGFRDLEGRLSCVMGIGSDAWDRFFGGPRPKDLHPFREIHGVHHAVATPGDLLFHIRSVRMDLCFELATQIMTRLGGGGGSAAQWPRRRRCTASNISMNATCSASSTERRIRSIRVPSTPPLSAMKM